MGRTRGPFGARLKLFQFFYFNVISKHYSCTVFYVENVHTMKAYWGREGLSPPILSRRFTHRRNSPLYSLNIKLGEPQGQSGHFVKERNFLFLPRVETQFLCWEIAGFFRGWILPYSGLLLSVRWFETDVPVLPIGPIFKLSKKLPSASLLDSSTLKDKTDI